MGRKKEPAPVVNLATLPVLLKLTDMAAVYRISERTIRRLVERNEFHPIPYEKYPYRWRRDDVIRDLNGPSRKLRTAPHGFAKARQVDAGAELTTK
jgi:Helix-turn-helix domain